MGVGEEEMVGGGALWGEWGGAEEVPGKAPLTAKHTVKMVMSVLSAMGSITVPTTVCRFHRRAI